MNAEQIDEVISKLQAGETPELSADMFPCFSEEALVGNEFVRPTVLDDVAKGLTPADIPMLERCASAMREGELAWLGVKVAYNPAEAVTNTDNAVTIAYGDVGCADGDSLLFFCNDDGEIVASRPYSPRDEFQMLDITRGPGMHNEQFPGVRWFSVPLSDYKHVWLIGASDVASEVSALAQHVGFRVSVVDCDGAFLSPERFPGARRLLLPDDSFDGLFDMRCDAGDYVCVLTRGHMFDPQGCTWAVRCNAGYVGMMGCAGKNSRVHDLVIEQGLTEEDWERVKRPIGLKFGAKTPAELAIAIVAELIDMRYKERYSAEAQQRHEQSLGRK